MASRTKHVSKKLQTCYPGTSKSTTGGTRPVKSMGELARAVRTVRGIVIDKNQENAPQYVVQAANDNMLNLPTSFLLQLELRLLYL